MDTPPAPPATPPEEPPPTPEQIAQWKSWLEPGQPPILRRIAEKALGEAGLLTPAPAPPAQPVPPDATAPDPQAGGGEPAAPRAAPTGQDAPETTGDTPDGESVHPDPIGPQEPPQAPPQRRGAPAPLGGLVATSWAAMMARAAQSPEPRRGPKASTLVAEELLRAWSETGEERYLEDALNALCAHWRDWKRETREHWKGCLAEIRTGLVTLDEILGILSDAERRGIQSRARYFSHHLGQVLGQHREERAQNRTSGAVF